VNKRNSKVEIRNRNVHWLIVNFALLLSQQRDFLHWKMHKAYWLL